MPLTLAMQILRKAVQFLLAPGSSKLRRANIVRRSRSNRPYIGIRMSDWICSARRVACGRLSVQPPRLPPQQICRGAVVRPYQFT